MSLFNTNSLDNHSLNIWAMFYAKRLCLRFWHLHQKLKSILLLFFKEFSLFNTNSLDNSTLHHTSNKEQCSMLSDSVWDSGTSTKNSRQQTILPPHNVVQCAYIFLCSILFHITIVYKLGGFVKKSSTPYVRPLDVISPETSI